LAQEKLGVADFANFAFLVSSHEGSSLSELVAVVAAEEAAEVAPLIWIVGFPALAALRARILLLLHGGHAFFQEKYFVVL